MENFNAALREYISNNLPNDYVVSPNTQFNSDYIAIKKKRSQLEHPIVMIYLMSADAPNIIEIYPRDTTMLDRIHTNYKVVTLNETYFALNIQNPESISHLTNIINYICKNSWK